MEGLAVELKSTLVCMYRARCASSSEPWGRTGGAEDAQQLGFGRRSNVLAVFILSLASI